MRYIYSIRCKNSWRWCYFFTRSYTSCILCTIYYSSNSSSSISCITTISSSNSNLNSYIRSILIYIFTIFINEPLLFSLVSPKYSNITPFCRENLCLICIKTDSYIPYTFENPHGSSAHQNSNNPCFW